MRRRMTCLLLLVALPCYAYAQTESVESVGPAPPTSTESSSKEFADAVAPSNPDAFKELIDGPDPTNGPPSTSIAVNLTSATTMGVLTQLERFLHPLGEILWLFLDSLLRNTRNVALPCIITAWVPLEGTCTPVVV